MQYCACNVPSCSRAQQTAWGGAASGRYGVGRAVGDSVGARRRSRGRGIHARARRQELRPRAALHPKAVATYSGHVATYSGHVAACITCASAGAQVLSRTSTMEHGRRKLHSMAHCGPRRRLCAGSTLCSTDEVVCARQRKAVQAPVHAPTSDARARARWQSASKPYSEYSAPSPASAGHRAEVPAAQVGQERRKRARDEPPALRRSQRPQVDLQAAVNRV